MIRREGLGFIYIQPAPGYTAGFHGINKIVEAGGQSSPDIYEICRFFHKPKLIRIPHSLGFRGVRNGNDYKIRYREEAVEIIGGVFLEHRGFVFPTVVDPQNTHAECGANLCGLLTDTANAVYKGG